MIEYYDGDIPDPRGRDAVRSGPLYEAGFILYSVVTDEKRHMKLHCEHEYKYDGSLPHGSSPDCYKCSKCGNTFFD